MSKTTTRGGYGLNDSPFYKLSSRKKLADLLWVSHKTLASLCKDNQLYDRCWKHKKSDSWLKSKPAESNAEQYRPIDIPNSSLKAVQSRIADLLGRIAPPDYLFSPVRGRSYVDNAARHLGADTYWLLDVADYFANCSANNVARFFRRDLLCSPDVTAILIKLVTLDGSLPQGSPCSPILAYFSNRPMWDEINKLVEEAECMLSVYADDLTISGRMIPKATIWRIKKTVHRHGLRLKPSKEASLIARHAEVTGVIVRKDGRLAVPNRKLKLLAELSAQRSSTRDPDQKKLLGRRIAGRKAQRKQVEGRFGSNPKSQIR